VSVLVVASIDGSLDCLSRSESVKLVVLWWIRIMVRIGELHSVLQI